MGSGPMTGTGLKSLTIMALPIQARDDWHVGQQKYRDAPWDIEAFCLAQVKLRGFRIELGEIENVLARCPNVQLAIVKLAKDSAGTDHLVAYLTPASVDVDAVKSQTAESVPGDAL